MGEHGGWEKIKQLGKGGQSQVFLARSPSRVAERQKYLDIIKELAGQGFNDVRAQNFVEATFGYGRNESISELGALKIYAPRATGLEAEKQALARLSTEITVLGNTRRGLPRLLASNEYEKWIVTEFFPQGTLEQHLLEFQGNPLLCLAAFRTVVETVSQLHKDGVVHRDIKPANVFVGNDGRLILGDFGIAFLPNLPERLTFTNESVGPRDYMPPWAETEERLEEVTSHFDVYMLGKLLWCMIAGRLKLPREWHRRSEFDLNAKFPNDPNIFAINNILDKCLQDDKDEIFPSALELLQAVDSLLIVMKRGGQMLTEDAPRPCRVCGHGFYERSINALGPLSPVVVLTTGEAAIPGNYSHSWRETGRLFAEVYVCNYCGNIELFRPVQLGSQ